MCSLSTLPWLLRVSGSEASRAATPYSGSPYVALLRLVKIRPSSPRMPSLPVPPEIQSWPQPPTASSSSASPKTRSLPPPT